SKTPGARAILNALHRIAEGYEPEIQETQQQIELATRQLADYETHLGTPFTHEVYQNELSDLRTKLQDALSSAGPAGDSQLSTAELSSRIKTLLSGAAPDEKTHRPSATSVGAEEPVTTRIHRMLRPESQGSQEITDFGPSESEYRPTATVNVATVQPLQWSEHREPAFL
ncbi:MAG: hypothetical protein KDA96_26315, partial [Planctomycetaceae bacterium]|nr:hypothetical protein [Planctomycetaceae bacterium]